MIYIRWYILTTIILSGFRKLRKILGLLEQKVETFGPGLGLHLEM
jgi:hypothetical protein